MSRQCFSSGTRFLWQGNTYEVLRLLPGEQINIENISTGTILVEKMSVLVCALFKGELEFAIKGKPKISDGIVDLSDYPEKLVAIAKSRLDVIRPLLMIAKRSRNTIQERVKEVQGSGPPTNHASQVSVASVYRWIRDYLDSDGDLRSLIPNTHKCGASGTPRLSTEIEKMIKQVIEDKYYVREKVTIEDLRDEVAVRVTEENRMRSPGQQLAIPSQSTLTRRIRVLPPYDKMVTKSGIRMAKQEFSQYKQTKYPIMPLERVEIDHTISDLIVIDEKDNLPLGRPTLTYCLDMATRYPLGYYLGFEPPSYLSVMECLYHAICPKEDIREKYGTEHEWVSYGIPGVLIVDNGKEFIGSDLEDACQLLGIVLQQAPVRNPQFKAGVERNYRSLNTMFFHKLPGTTFSNVQERGDYDSAKQACVSLSDIDKILSTFIVDIYAQQFHRGLNSTPANRWKEMTKNGFMPALPPNAEELSILLGRAAMRVVHHYGIEFASLRYNCDDLVTLRTRLKSEKTKIKYHPADLSYLHVYDPFEKQYIRVPSLNQEYTQKLSLWKHKVIRQAVLSEQNSVDIVALGRAKRKIQELVEQGRQRKRQQTRKRIARWDTAGKPACKLVEEKQPETILDAYSEDAQIISLPKIPITVDWQPDEQPDSDWELVYRNDLFKDKKKKDLQDE